MKYVDRYCDLYGKRLCATLFSVSSAVEARSSGPVGFFQFDSEE